MITIQFTNDEAATLLEILTKTPLPHNVSHALIVKVGTALQLERQADDMRKMQINKMRSATPLVDDADGFQGDAAMSKAEMLEYEQQTNAMKDKEREHKNG